MGSERILRNQLGKHRIFDDRADELVRTVEELKNAGDAFSENLFLWLKNSDYTENPSGEWSSLEEAQASYDKQLEAFHAAQATLRSLELAVARLEPGPVAFVTPTLTVQEIQVKAYEKGQTEGMNAFEADKDLEADVKALESKLNQFGIAGLRHEAQRHGWPKLSPELALDRESRDQFDEGVYSIVDAYTRGYRHGLFLGETVK